MITYNHEPFIEQAINSILMQKTDFLFNLVIGEDCSTDKTLNKIKPYEKNCQGRIRLIHSDQNIGMLPNLIRSLNACIGKYTAICEGDDYWTDPLKLQKQIYFLEANPEYGLVSSDIILIDRDGKRLSDNKMVISQRQKRKSDADFFDLLDTNLVNTLTVCARTDLLKGLANRIVEKNLWFVIDYWLWLNIAIDYKIKIFDYKTAAYRVHPSSIGHKKAFFETRIDNILYDAIRRYFKKHSLSELDKKQVKILAKTSLRLIFSKHLRAMPKFFVIVCLIRSPRVFFAFIDHILHRNY